MDMYCSQYLTVQIQNTRISFYFECLAYCTVNSLLGFPIHKSKNKVVSRNLKMIILFN